MIDDLDIMLFRDGKVRSALTVTAPNVVVVDGELNIAFEASAGKPLLSALVVRGKSRPEIPWQLAWGDEFDGDRLDDAADAFHDYAIEWTPQRIDAWVDDTLYFSSVNGTEGWRVWPFDKPFHLILNVAVGGVWGRAGGPIDDTALPQRMLVDHVRVYQRGG